MAEAKIRDYERDEVVGRVTEDGIEPDDSLFADVVGESFDDGKVEVVYPGDEAGEYRTITVRPGERGYVREVVDELPSPFDIDDTEKLSDLEIYEPDEVDKGVQVINLDKRRVYIDDTSEAPPGVDVQTGQRGGLYYVPVGEEDEQDSDVRPEGMISIDHDDVERDDYVSMDGVEGFVSDVENIGGKARIQLTSGKVVEVGPNSHVFINDEKDPAGEDPTEVQMLVDDMEVTDFPGIGVLSEEDARAHLQSMAGYTDGAIREEVFESVSVSDDAPMNHWNTDENAVKLSDDAGDGVLAHEMGHAMVGVFGSDIEPYANMPAHVYSSQMFNVAFGETKVIEWAMEQIDRKVEESILPQHEARERYQAQIDKIRDEFDEDDVFEVEDFKLTPPDSGPEEIASLVEQANETFEFQVRAARADVSDEEYYIGKPYSSMNAHETMAMTHEVLQGGAADRQSIENLYLRHTDFFKAWLDLFEPDYLAKSMINQVYEENGSNDIFDSMPYPVVEG